MRNWVSSKKTNYIAAKATFSKIQQFFQWMMELGLSFKQSFLSKWTQCTSRQTGNSILWWFNQDEGYPHKKMKICPSFLEMLAWENKNTREILRESHVLNDRSDFLVYYELPENMQ